MTKPNRLIHETSPYLLQHAHNPVDWYPWGDEALNLAKATNKPIILSIGYTACHWCHVMEHESFESELIANLMNEHFVSIKVDREERPDLDQIYQNVAQVLTHSGGWPLTVFLTPDQKPFFGGTYFPPTQRYGRPGFADILFSISEAWKNSVDDINHNVLQLMKSIENLQEQNQNSNTHPPGEINRILLDEIGNKLLRDLDTTHGGFGSHPKFPHTSTLTYLLRWGNSTQNNSAISAALFSLEKMARGGIFDQLSGGFHRYTVDESWLTPHFEKMLYDNALLLKLYSEALITSTMEVELKDLFIDVIEKTVQFCFDELKDSAGGFYSSLDADSLNSENHSEEGYFYTWNYAVLKNSLNPDEFTAFTKLYSVTPTGNFENNSTILTQNHSPKNLGINLNHLETARAKCSKDRTTRKRPTCDDKIITSWNGLMISGLLWSAEALKNHNKPLSEAINSSALLAFDFICDNLMDENQRLKTSIKNRNQKGHGYLDDYAYMIQAALDIVRFNLQENDKVLNLAKKWTSICVQYYLSPEYDFYFTASDQESLIVRPKSIWDQSIPSATSVMIQNLKIIAEYDSDEKFNEQANAILMKNLPALNKYPLGLSELANAAMLAKISPILVTGTFYLANPFVFKNSSKTSNKVQICHNFKCVESAHFDHETLKSYIQIS